MKTDGQLIEQVLMGDRTAYSELADRYLHVLFALGYHMTGDFHLAQDIAQEAILKGYNKLSTLKDPEKFGSWIYAIARRTSIDMLRKYHVERATVELPVDLADPVTPDGLWDQQERRAAVWEALGKLSDTCRETAILHFMSGIGAGKIGKVLGITVSAVESRLRRAKQQLKQELSELVERTLEANKPDDAFRIRVTSMLLQQISCIYLPVRDPYASARWYRDLFKVEVTSPVEPGCRGASISIASGMEIYLLKYSGEDKNLTTQMELLMFEVDNLESLVGQLRTLGVDVGTIERHAGRVCCRFKDPDGHQFILSEAP